MAVDDRDVSGAASIRIGSQAARRLQAAAALLLAALRLVSSAHRRARVHDDTRDAHLRHAAHKNVGARARRAAAGEKRRVCSLSILCKRQLCGQPNFNRRERPLRAPTATTTTRRFQAPFASCLSTSRRLAALPPPLFSAVSPAARSATESPPNAASRAARSSRSASRGAKFTIGALF